MHRNLLLALLAVLVALLAPIYRAHSENSSFVWIQKTGPEPERINLVFLAEGFREDESPAFLTEVREQANYLFQQQPFLEYRRFFNVAAVPVISSESGTDDPSEGVERDTYFNSSFDSWGLSHGLTIPPNNFEDDASLGFGKARDLLTDVFPSYDLIVVVVNSKQYGGWGDHRGVVTSSHAFAGEALTHEMAHAFAGLGDEYTDPFPQDPEPVKEEPNTTRETRRDKIKWRAWIQDSTPIPTPEEGYADVVGVFEGARYHETGWFRPRLKCRMSALWFPFCEVCRETLVLSIYRRQEGIVAATPDPSLRLTGSQKAQLAFELLRPASLIEWEIDGAREPDEGATLREVHSWSLGPGEHIVTIRATDSTNWVRNDPEELLQSLHTWRIAVEDLGEGDSPQLLFPLYERDSHRFTGLAFTNYQTEGTELRLTALSSQGEELETVGSGPDLVLSGYSQKANLASELFSSEEAAWFRAEVEAPEVAGLFLVGDGESLLDGGKPGRFPLKHSFLHPLFSGPEAFLGRSATSQIYIANPALHAVVVDLRLHDGMPEGSILEKTITLPPLGQVSSSLRDLLDFETSLSGAFLEIQTREGTGTVSYALVETGEGSSLFSIAGAPPSDSTDSCSAQFAEGRGIFTDLHLVNPGPQEGSARVLLIGDDGKTLSTHDYRLAPAESVRVDGSELLPSDRALPDLQVASVCIEKEGPQIQGSIVVGDPALRYLTAAPLQETPLLEALFSQVANTSEIFTGLALLNPGDVDTLIEVEVFDPSGELIGSETLPLPPKGRLARLVSEIAPGSAGVTQGYLRIRADHPFMALQIFGASDGSYYSLVPAHRVE